MVGKHFKNGTFRKRLHYGNHLISLLEFFSNTNPKSPVIAAFVKTQNCVSFLVTDNYNASSEEEVRREAVNIDTWLHRKDVAASFKCHQIIQNGFLTPRYVY